MYVANRFYEIQGCTEVNDWNYVGTKDNPADLASRPIFLKKASGEDPQVQKWIHGPEFLCQPPSEWPQCPVEVREVLEDDPELRASAFFTARSPDESDPLEKLIVRSPNMFFMKLRFAWLAIFCAYLKNRDVTP